MNFLAFWTYFHAEAGDPVARRGLKTGWKLRQEGETGQREMSGPGGKPTGVKHISKNTSNAASDLQPAGVKQWLTPSTNQDTCQKKHKAALNSGVIIWDKCRDYEFYDYFIGFDLDCQSKQIAALRRLWKNSVAVWCQRRRAEEALQRGKASALQGREARVARDARTEQASVVSSISAACWAVPKGVGTFI